MKVSPLAFLMVAWVCCVWGFSVSGQPNELRFEHFGLEDGLPNMSVQALTTDSYGFLWVGTWDGLSKYDGYHFTNFHPSPLDTTTLSFQDVKALDVDADGNVWIATQGGLNRYDPFSGKFRRFLPDQLNPSAIHRRFVNSVYCRKDGSVLAGIDYSTSYNIYNPVCDGFESTEVFGVALDFIEVNGQLWIGTSNGLFTVASGSSIAKPGGSTDAILAELNGRNIRCFQRGLHGEIWIGTLNGLYCYLPEQQKLQHMNLTHGLSHPYVLALTCDKFGGIWAGTSDGLSYLPPGANEFSVFRHNPNNPFSLTNDAVIALHIDESQNLWVGTANGGLNKAQLHLEKKFKTWNHTVFGARNRELMVFHFAEGKNNRLWVATNQGLYLLDKTDKTILDIYSQNLKGKNGLRGNGIFSVYEDGQDNVYVGIMDLGLDIIRLQTGVIDHFPVDTDAPQNIPGKDIRAIKESIFEGRRVIWLGTNSGWSGHDPDQEMIRSVSMKSGANIKWNGYLWDILPEDSTQMLWFISSWGLYQYDLRNETFVIGGWNPLHSGANNLFYPVSIYKNNDHIWLGTYGAGLLYYNLTSQTYQNYRIEHGLPNNMVYGILSDNNQNLWMSTNQGIAKFEQQNGTFTRYSTQDGLQDEEFASGAYLKAADGEMFFGGLNGFTSFYPDSIGEDNSIFQPHVLIQSVKVSGEEIETDTAWQVRREIRLPNYRNQHLEIRFIALDLSRPGKNLYQFKLKGYDQDWSKPSEKTIAQYTRIDPGDYHFMVRGSNSDGVMSPYTADLKIILTPLWYQTYWFQFGAPLAAILLVILYIYLRVQRLRTQEQLRLNYRIAMVKQEALAAQMDHHFTFNSLNSIQRYITDNDKSSAIRYISRFGQLLRRTLDHAKKNYLTIEEELSTLDLYLTLEQLRTKDRFVYEFITDPTVDVYNTEIPTNLLQPYIENAIWHGIMPLEDRQGKIRISFTQTDDILTCTIEDNGIGRKKSAELRAMSQLKHTSKGMELILERIETLNTLDHTHINITVLDLEEFSEETGTRVVVTMPVRA
ncbi:MAG: two-component regulator propeller domain-containing protein [Bacteroidia bacterium]